MSRLHVKTVPSESKTGMRSRKHTPAGGRAVAPDSLAAPLGCVPSHSSA